MIIFFSPSESKTKLDEYGSIYKESFIFQDKYAKRIEAVNVYNEYIKKVPQEEKQFVSENFMLFIKCGENARLAPDQVQKEIKA